MDESSRPHSPVSRLRQAALIHTRALYNRIAVSPAARGLYGRMARSNAAGVLGSRAVQRLRRGVQTEVDSADVLEILAALDASQVQAWVAGGWAVDALLGEQTREHGDLDLVLDLTDEGRARATLEELGFRRISMNRDIDFFPGALMPRRFVMRDGSGRTTELHGVDLDIWPASWFEHLEREGRLAVSIDPADAFAEGSFDGRSVPCLSPQLQIASRQVYEPTETDRQDVARLCAHLDVPLPPYLEVKDSQADVATL